MTAEQERLNKIIAEGYGWKHVSADEWGPLRGLPPGGSDGPGAVLHLVPNFAERLEKYDQIKNALSKLMNAVEVWRTGYQKHLGQVLIESKEAMR
jgi:hypothetical protein